ncbi:uncharacterized [Tachysurus ichikawai]
MSTVTFVLETQPRKCRGTAERRGFLLFLNSPRRPNCSTFNTNCRERMRNSLSVVLKDRAPESPPPIDAIGKGVYD